MESKIKDLRQLIFNFGHNKSFQKNDFFISESNYFAYELLMSWPKWEKKLINIYGAKSSGKTHLLEIFKQKNRAIKFEANNFSEDDLDKTNLEQNIILENLDNNFDENVIYTLIDLLEKQNKYLNCPSGGPLVQHSLIVMYEHYLNKKITLQKIVEKMCNNPAKIFKINKRGYIREGYYADLVILDPNKKQTISSNNILLFTQFIKINKNSNPNYYKTKKLF